VSLNVPDTLLEVRSAADSGTERTDELQARKSRWWAGKAFWAVLDQGLFATSNFVLGVLLARWLTPEQFGSFAVAHSGFLLAGTLHSGLFSEPMLVFASARHATRFSAYLDILLHAHWRLTGLGSVLLIGAALICWFLGSPPLAGALLGAAVAAPFILFGWLVRRACFSCLQPRWAAMGGTLYLVLLLAAISLLKWLGLLSAFAAFFVTGGAGLISGFWILSRLRRDSSAATTVGPSRGEVFRDHWSYGRWAVASSALSWIPGNIYSIVLPAFAGLEAAGALRALSNLAMPIMHANGALATLLIPALGSVRGRPAFDRVVRTALGAFVAGSLAYWLLLTSFRTPIIAWLYRGAYSDTTSLVPAMALLPLVAACMAVLGSALRVLERPQLVFRAYVISVAATVTIGIPLVARWGVKGAVAGLVLSSATTAAASGVYLLAHKGRASRWT
jgi:O-antigen/teichoic acid export membrane protein